MKINCTLPPEPPAAFRPVKLTLTLESQAEVDTLFAVGNWHYQLASELAKRESRDPSHAAPVTESAAREVMLPFYAALAAHRSRNDFN